MREPIVRRVRVAYPLFATALLFLGCRDGPTLPSRTWFATIGGAVIDARGQPVRDASITVQWVELGTEGVGKLGRCSGEPLTPMSGQADATGRYSFTITGSVMPIFSCLFVTATGKVLSTTLSGSAELDSVLVGPSGLDDFQILVRVQP